MPTTKTSKKGAPGQWLKRSAGRNRVVRVILTHAHVLQIIDDHQLMWLEAVDDEERELVRARCRNQLFLAGVNLAGFEVAVHGTVDLMFNPMFGGALLLLGAVIVYFTDRGH